MAWFSPGMVWLVEQSRSCDGRLPVTPQLKRQYIKFLKESKELDQMFQKQLREANEKLEDCEKEKKFWEDKVEFNEQEHDNQISILQKKHQEEIQQLRDQRTNEIKELQLTHRRDKQFLEEIIKQSQSRIDKGNYDCQIFMEMENKYLRDIKDLNDSFDEYKVQVERHILQLQNEKEILQKGSEDYEMLVNKLKRTLRNNTNNHEMNTKRLRDKIVKLENESIQCQQDNKKYLAKIKLLKQHIKRLEINEKKFKNSFHQTKEYGKKNQDSDQTTDDVKTINNCQTNITSNIYDSLLQNQNHHSHNNLSSVQENQYCLQNGSQQNNKLITLSQTRLPKFTIENQDFPRNLTPQNRLEQLKFGKINENFASNIIRPHPYSQFVPTQANNSSNKNPTNDHNNYIESDQIFHKNHLNTLNIGGLSEMTSINNSANKNLQRMIKMLNPIQNLQPSPSQVIIDCQNQLPLENIDLYFIYQKIFENCEEFKCLECRQIINQESALKHFEGGATCCRQQNLKQSDSNLKGFVSSRDTSLSKNKLNKRESIVFKNSFSQGLNSLAATAKKNQSMSKQRTQVQQSNGLEQSQRNFNLSSSNLHSYANYTLDIKTPKTGDMKTQFNQFQNKVVVNDLRCQTDIPDQLSVEDMKNQVYLLQKLNKQLTNQVENLISQLDQLQDKYTHLDQQKQKNEGEMQTEIRFLLQQIIQLKDQFQSEDQMHTQNSNNFEQETQHSKHNISRSNINQSIFALNQRANTYHKNSSQNKNISQNYENTSKSKFSRICFEPVNQNILDQGNFSSGDSLIQEPQSLGNLNSFQNESQRDSRNNGAANQKISDLDKWKNLKQKTFDHPKSNQQNGLAASLTEKNLISILQDSKLVNNRKNNGVYNQVDLNDSDSENDKTFSTMQGNVNEQPNSDGFLQINQCSYTPSLHSRKNTCITQKNFHAVSAQIDLRGSYQMNPLLSNHNLSVVNNDNSQQMSNRRALAHGSFSSIKEFSKTLTKQKSFVKPTLKPKTNTVKENANPIVTSIANLTNQNQNKQKLLKGSMVQRSVYITRQKSVNK